MLALLSGRRELYVSISRPAPAAVDGASRACHFAAPLPTRSCNRLCSIYRALAPLTELPAAG